MKRGRPSRVAQEPSLCRLEMRLTLNERVALLEVARETNLSVSAVLREAVNEFVGDYRERAVFDSAK